ncbi:Segment polarity protein dishevelled-like protein DVL-3 [Heterocephalus glaber]|uniref:Segment polarity protein dishevelled-like protein DVL-3 n=1 Tax=Heterocephalus glaber TaxID=10181 RepID=G5BTE2_HETGA|nr:Segment polarity protein dishevelled-like protein DVL-3 [Heterocephalus glaber]
MGETKIIYHLDGQEPTYLVTLPLPAERVTLADFKGVLQRPSYKFFFKSMDDDFGVVKEEISDDNAKLPCFNGRVVSWLVSAEGSHPEPAPFCADNPSELPPPMERTGGIGDSRPPSFHPHASGGSQENLDNDTETDSLVSAQRERPRRRDGPEHATRLNGTAKGERRREPGGYDSSSTLMSSELETTSFFDSDEDDSTSRWGFSPMGASRLMRRHKRRRRKQKISRIERSSSFSSITDSTMSLNIITVTLNMEKYNFLGISIVGQSNERGDGGIYIGSIRKGGAGAADGRIEPGDMLLQVNEINFENMSNDDAVRVLREIVHKPGPITLTVAKCWDPSPRGCFTLPRSEPIRPIDPAAWVSHTAAMTGTFPAYGMSPSLSTITSTSSSITSSIPDTERLDDFHLSIHSDMAAIVKAMASPESGLEVRDRMWLKITIPNAFIGSDVVDWLYHNVEGFTDRREARKYASNLLKAGFIRHTVNKITFSEQCYYIFGDLCGNMANLSLHDHDGSSGASDQDTLAPLPHPGAAPWPMAFPYQYPPPPHPYNPHPGFPELCYSYGGASSQHSEGKGSRAQREPRASPGFPCPLSVPALALLPPLSGPPVLMMPPPPAAMGPPGAPPGRDLASVPPELTASRQSFRMAMGNPSEFFVDVM